MDLKFLHRDLKFQQQSNTLRDVYCRGDLYDISPLDQMFAVCLSNGVMVFMELKSNFGKTRKKGSAHLLAIHSSSLCGYVWEFQRKHFQFCTVFLQELTASR